MSNAQVATRSSNALRQMCGILLAGLAGASGCANGAAGTRDAVGSTPGCVFSNPTQWYAEHREFLASFHQVPISDEKQLRAKLQTIVHARDDFGPAIDEQALAESIYQFLRALAAPSPKAYLEMVGPTRPFRRDISSDKIILAAFHDLSIESVPDMVGSEQLFEMLWHSSAEGVGRPLSVADVAPLQIRFTKPIPSPRPSSGIQLVNVTIEPISETKTGSVFPWIGYLANALPLVTKPAESFEQAILRQGQLITCTVLPVVQTDRGVLVPMEVLLFASSPVGPWSVEWVVNHHPNKVYWPI